MSRWLKRILFSSMILVLAYASIVAQETRRAQPDWWFGLAAAGNYNAHRGTTQVLNALITAPTPFHEGKGAGFYATALWEYRPDPVWGAMLYAGYETRSGVFEDVRNPNNYPAELSTRLGYLTIEPSLRIAPFSSSFYLFIGPRIGYNVKKAFTYTITTPAGNPSYEARLDWSEMRSVVYSAQVGAGFEIPLRSPNHATQMNLSPFVSFQPYYGQDPRSNESWNVTTLRVGVALKWGSGDVIARAGMPYSEAAERDVHFSIRAPKAIPAQRKVRETFPMRNYVFFDEGSTEVPSRYVALTNEQAAKFKEEQLQVIEPKKHDRSFTKAIDTVLQHPEHSRRSPEEQSGHECHINRGVGGG